MPVRIYHNGKKIYDSSVDSEKWDDVLEELIKKYGPPKSIVIRGE
ncbi:MAG: hypothetical protein ACTSUO_00815 [Candidatus Thorarchaeota archaeon]